jgi:hypothetical protein
MVAQLVEEMERLTAELNTTRRNLHAAVQAAWTARAGGGQLYTCDGKGGEYELVGASKGAGTLRDTAPLTVYRDTKDGQLYHRHTPDFNSRMTSLGRCAPDAHPEMRGMADCMHMVREELIEAGVVDASVPPMFLTEAIIAHIRRETKKP